eukprot:2054376-Amphidinium_carterae.1
MEEAEEKELRDEQRRIQEQADKKKEGIERLRKEAEEKLKAEKNAREAKRSRLENSQGSHGDNRIKAVEKKLPKLYSDEESDENLGGAGFPRIGRNTIEVKSGLVQVLFWKPVVTLDNSDESNLVENIAQLHKAKSLPDIPLDPEPGDCCGQMGIHGRC